MRRRQMAWERDEESFFSVQAVVRNLAAPAMYSWRLSVEVMGCSAAPAMWVAPKESSRMEIGFRAFRRSVILRVSTGGLNLEEVKRSRGWKKW